MGACFAKPDRPGTEEKLSKAPSAVSDIGSVRGANGKRETRSSDGGKRPSVRVLGDAAVAPLDDDNSVPPPHNTRCTNAQLAHAVEYWDAESRVHELSAEQLKESYDLDSTTLLDTLENIEQVVKVRRREQKIAAYTRVRRSGSSKALQLPRTSESHSRRSLESASRTSSGRLADRGESLSQLVKKDNSSFAQARQHYKNGKMLSARRVLLRWCNKRGLELDDLEDSTETLGFDIRDLQDHGDRIDEMLRLMKDESGYSIARDDGDLRVLYKCVDGKIHHVKMEADLPVHLEQPLSLAREFDLMSTWNHYVKDSTVVYAPTIWESWVYAGLWMPFPFPTIDALAKGQGYDLSEEDKCLLVSMESVEEAELPKGAQPLPRKVGKRKRATVMRGSAIRFEALPPRKDGTHVTKGTILAIVNPHILHVPSFVISFVLSVVAPFAYRQIIKLLDEEFDDPSKPFPQRMARNPDLYKRARKVVSEGILRHYGITVPE